MKNTLRALIEPRKSVKKEKVNAMNWKVRPISMNKVCEAIKME